MASSHSVIVSGILLFTPHYMKHIDTCSLLKEQYQLINAILCEKKAMTAQLRFHTVWLSYVVACCCMHESQGEHQNYLIDNFPYFDSANDKPSWTTTSGLFVF